jgi:hypothetical protein
MALLGGLAGKLKGYVQDPKVQKYVLMAGSYAAGAYGGPPAKRVVEEYGPVVGPYIVKGIVLLLGG